jgi:hypothetical protein
MAYDELNGVWFVTGVAVPAKPKSDAAKAGESTSKPVSAGKSKAQEEADKAALQAVMNTLNGDMGVIPLDDAIMGLKAGDTVKASGLGKYLSGRYFVRAVKRSITAEGYAQALTVTKTGFGDYIKMPINIEAPQDESRQSPSEIEKAPEGKDFSPGSKVKIIAPDAVYAGASAGAKVPEWVKGKTHTVSKVSDDGSAALLKEINSWVYTKYIARA